MCTYVYFYVSTWICRTVLSFSGHISCSSRRDQFWRILWHLSYYKCKFLYLHQSVSSVHTNIINNDNFGDQKREHFLLKGKNLSICQSCSNTPLSWSFQSMCQVYKGVARYKSFKSCWKSIIERPLSHTKQQKRSSSSSLWITHSKCLSGMRDICSCLQPEK